MKKTIWILVIAICCVVCLVLCACGDNTDANTDKDDKPVEQLAEFEGISFADNTVEYDGTAHSLAVEGAPEGTHIEYTANSYTEVGTYTVSATLAKEGYKSRTMSATLKVTVPSADSVVAARANVTKEQSQAYDFRLNMAGTVSVSGYSGAATANYQGQYRYDAQSGQIQFARTTSGLLLYDATEYIMTQGDTRIEVDANDKGKVKAIKILGNGDEELTLVNRPFTALVDALKAENLTNIQSASGDYKFCANVSLTADNALVKKALSIIAKQGTSISMKGVSFTNPVNGLVLYFNLGADKKLTDFRFSAELSVPVSGAQLKIALTYEQNAANGAIALPNLGNVILDKAQISQELATITSAVVAVKDSANYSLDVEAVNEFDPGWNALAIKDKYNARMFKHTYTLNGQEFVAFNHSYEYLSHHETDGKETYKYTIGNIQDGSVYLVSRKGNNTVSPLTNVTVDTQFAYLTDVFAFDADNIDCITKETKSGVTTYHLYLGDASVLSIGEKVLSVVNSNDQEGVGTVNNYVNEEECQIKASTVAISVAGGAVTNIEMETTLKYVPIAGEYVGEGITLTDTMTLVVNKNLDDAKKYEAPKKSDAALVGLSASKFYIN